MGDLKTASIYLQKGGVGKTTSAANLAVGAAEDGYDVLLIDLAGTQNDLSVQFGIDLDDDDIDAPISAVFGDDWSFLRDNVDNLLERMTIKTGEGPDLIPADPGLGGADSQLSNVPVEDRFGRLSSFVDDLVKDEYDLLILDLPGAESNIALNGLAGTENIVSPVRPGSFEEQQLASLDETVEELSADLGIDLELSLVIPTMIDRRESQSEKFIDEIREEYPDRVGSAIPRSADIGSSQDRGETLFSAEELYDTGERAAEAYEQNARTLIEKL